MGLKKQIIVGFECENCQKVVAADSVFSEDYPEGYFVHLRRVTQAHNHYITGEIFFCDKDCLVNFMQYGITASTRNWSPISPNPRRKR